MQMPTYLTLPYHYLNSTACFIFKGRVNISNQSETAEHRGQITNDRHALPILLSRNLAVNFSNNQTILHQ